VAVTVTVEDPVAAVLLADKVRVELPFPGAAMDAGLKLAVTPAGNPEADNEIAELNPPVAVVETVVLPEPPWATVRLAGETLKPKSGVAAALIVNETEAVWVFPPPLAVTVTVAVPVAAAADAVNVSVELPFPGAAMEVGLKLAVTPAGNPATDSETAELKPPLIVVETATPPELPWVRVSDAGEAARLKSAVTCFQISEIGVAVAALPTWVKPYKSSSVRRTLK